MFWELFWITFLCLIILDYVTKKRRNDMLEKSHIPGPKPVPLFGNAFLFRFVNTENVFYYTKYNKETYGKIYRFWLLNNLTVEVVDCKYLEPILSNQQLVHKADTYDFLQSWLGTGLLMSTGKKWHSRRKIITPTFHFKILEQFIEVFDRQSNIMVQKLYEKADGENAVDIYPIICLAALDIIAESAMGVKVHAQESPNLGYVRALAYVSKIMSARIIKPLNRIDWLYKITHPKEYCEVTRCIKIMHDFTNKVIEQRREMLQESVANGTYAANQENDDDNDGLGTKKRMALLDVLLQSTVAGAPLSNEDIREEVDTFMFEGHDTTTSGISFCLYLISRYPDVQKKLIEEINDVFGDDLQRSATYRDLQELKYLDCVIKESLRLYPPVPAIGRQTTADTVISDIILPANTNIIIKLFMAMRDPDYFPDPAVFKPERFLPENNTTKMNPFAHTPFSAGPRNCIGQKFAMLEIKSTISKVLRHFELLPLGAQVRPITNLTLRSVTGVNLGLKPRSRSMV